MRGRPQLLVVDDEVHIRESIEEYFSLHDFVVHGAEDGVVMREIMGREPIDCVVLDLRLPGEDGLALCRYLRDSHDVGVVMLTGSADTVDKVVGLEMGADDYLAKPFELRELLARVRSVLRRVRASGDPDGREKADKSNDEVRIGDRVVNLTSRVLIAAGGDEVQLGSMEFDLLKAFLDHPNRVLSRDQLLELAHGRGWEPFDRSIDVRITRLRKKIEPDPANPRFIRTMRGAGYMFVPKGR